MAILQKFIDILQPIAPTGITVLVIVVVMIAVRYVLEKRYGGTPGHRFRLQLIMLILTLAGLLVVILVLPISDTSRGQLLSLIGILLSAAIALSATTFVGNAFGGLMLRAVKSFRAGDFIRVGDHFGRVSERGLFHVEIQTEDRDLTTIPNLYLVTNPVKVIRSSGTIVSAEVSLGYDIPHTKISELLINAAGTTGLQEPFVHITELGDFSVTYRVAGLLTEVKQIITTRSKLREMMLDALHDGGVEIVSPAFMNTRSIPEGKLFIPAKVKEKKVEEPEAKVIPEEVVFDKAEEAESVEKLQFRHESLGKEIDEIKKHLAQTKEEGEKKQLKTQIEQLEKRREKLADIIEQRQEQGKK